MSNRFDMLGKRPKVRLQCGAALVFERDLPKISIERCELSRFHPVGTVPYLLQGPTSCAKWRPKDRTIERYYNNKFIFS